jgi:hypothetical protein
VVTDGHMKNTRKHCLATFDIASYDANDSCCTNSPIQGSYFCLAHNSLSSENPVIYDGIFDIILLF